MTVLSTVSSSVGLPTLAVWCAVGLILALAGLSVCLAVFRLRADEKQETESPEGPSPEGL